MEASKEMEDALRSFLTSQASAYFDDEDDLRMANLKLQNEIMRLNMPSGYGETSTMAQLAPFLGAGIARSIPRPSHEIPVSDINLAKRFPELKNFIQKPRTGLSSIPGLGWVNSMKGLSHATADANSASSLISRIFRR